MAFSDWETQFKELFAELCEDPFFYCGILPRDMKVMMKLMASREDINKTRYKEKSMEWCIPESSFLCEVYEKDKKEVFKHNVYALRLMKIQYLLDHEKELSDDPDSITLSGDEESERRELEMWLAYNEDYMIYHDLCFRPPLTPC